MNIVKGKTYRERREEMLNGSILKTLLSIGWPVAIGNILQIVYNFADTFWVAKLGVENVAATTLAFPIVFLFLSVAMGLAVAGVSLVSQQIGAGQDEKKDEVAGQVLIFMLLLSAGIGVLGYLFSETVLSLLGGTETVVSLGKTFLQPLFLSMPFMFTWFTFASLFRAQGNTRTPMILNGLTLSINLALDPFFIFGWGIFPAWGLFGSAITDVIGRAIAAVLALFLLFSGRMGLHIRPHHLKPRMKWLKKFISIGGPSSLSSSFTALGFTVLMALIAQGGTDVLSVYGIGSQITRMSNIVVIGLVSGLGPMIGQNIGAGQKERAHEILKKAAAAVFGITAVLSLIIFFFRRPLYSFFIQDGGIIREGGRFLSIFALSIPFFGIFRVAGSVFQGSGHTKHSMFLSVIRIWVIRIGLSSLLYSVLGLGIVGLWVGIALGNFLGGSLSMFWVSFVHWEERVIDVPPSLMKGLKKPAGVLKK
ncbi:MAG: MATE family efflux transporter [Candidatus Korarchaeota archaeon]|nr:MATE family efflux transporter [Candidatus Korarchaeota archaeon]NIU82056.1 MATE family efflux transporter [Candidatus Thorarchaeota archaeon]NIW12474.1 MATE family efflux transporter [Candidatus Thorarchaeota archaeon]NIW50689.1 MATE family efflux transporter [Candidatus Korarchaeota archaeon]